MRAILKEDLHTNDRLIAYAGDEIEVDNIGDEQKPVWIYAVPGIVVGVDPDQIQVLRD